LKGYDEPEILRSQLSQFGTISADAGQTERDAGRLAGLTGAEKDRIKELEREVRELRQANEILKKASAYFAAAELVL
jgi:transposase-like protein